MLFWEKYRHTCQCMLMLIMVIILVFLCKEEGAGRAGLWTNEAFDDYVLPNKAYIDIAKMQVLLDAEHTQKEPIIDVEKIIDSAPLDLESIDDDPDARIVDKSIDAQSFPSSTDLFPDAQGWWSDVINCKTNNKYKLYCKDKARWIFPY